MQMVHKPQDVAKHMCLLISKGAGKKRERTAQKEPGLRKVEALGQEGGELREASVMKEHLVGRDEILLVVEAWQTWRWVRCGS